MSKNSGKTNASIKPDVHAMLADLAAVRERAHTLILVRELAASHKLEKKLHIRMLEKQAA